VENGAGRRSAVNRGVYWENRVGGRMSTVGEAVESIAAAEEVETPVEWRASSLVLLDVGLFALVVLSVIIVAADLLR
jgi:hypothetical protein